jgi:hypothetical protein
MSCSSPVIFLIFNRPELTAQVFEVVRQAQPEKLLVIADGPRNETEVSLCQQTRAITERIDWDCVVLRNYADVNLGCRKRISSGLDWAFNQVNEAIILEDDCLPTPSFFYFCQNLLEYYRDDERIMHISGNNYLFNADDQRNSYMFSQYPHIWGWASWRRAWKHYDVSISNWPQMKDSGIMKNFFEDPYAQRYWTEIFDAIFNNKIDTWDYQWTYTCLLQNGLSILPTSNLISNLGFRKDSRLGTDSSPWANLPTTDIWSIMHPHFVLRHREVDAYTFDIVIGGKSLKQADTFLGKIRSHYLTTRHRTKRFFINPLGTFKSIYQKLRKVPI